MGEVISATTRFARPSGRASEFLLKADVLLRQARHHRRIGELEIALELAYQSALRTAGAVVAASPLVSKKKKLTSAWDRLALVDDNAASWAAEFSAFSPLRSRVASGLVAHVEGTLVDGLLVRVEKFLDETLSGTGSLSEVA